MKTFKFFALFFIIVTTISTPYAQPQVFPNEPMGPEASKYLKYWGGAELNIVKLLKSTSWTQGIAGALIVNDYFSTGFYVQALANDVRYRIKPSNDAHYADYLTFGLYQEICLWKSEKLQALLPLSTGWGEVSHYYQLPLANDSSQTSITQKYDGFWLIEPGLALEYALSDHLHVNVGAQYQWFNGIAVFQQSNSDYGGLAYHLMIKLGIFK